MKVKKKIFGSIISSIPPGFQRMNRFSLSEMRIDLFITLFTKLRICYDKVCRSWIFIDDKNTNFPRTANSLLARACDNFIHVNQLAVCDNILNAAEDADNETFANDHSHRMFSSVRQSCKRVLSN